MATIPMTSNSEPLVSGRHRLHFYVAGMLLQHVAPTRFSDQSNQALFIFSPALTFRFTFLGCVGPGTRLDWTEFCCSGDHLNYLDNMYDSKAMRQISELPTCRQHIMTTTNIKLVTSNPNKLADIGAILSAAGISIQSVAIDLVEIQGTVEEISSAKCRAAAEIVRRVLL